MQSSLHAHVINPMFGDPGVLVTFSFEKRAILFDLGDIQALNLRDILKITHVIVSHTHIDHFVGFDLLLRVLLGRDKRLTLYGPPGFLKNVQAKLSAYTWNLVESYQNRFILEVHEVHPKHIIFQSFACQNKFLPTQTPVTRSFDGILLSEPGLTIQGELLDHGTPCLGASIIECFHINIIKEKLLDLGLEAGPWIRTFKQALFKGLEPESIFTVGEQQFSLGWLRDTIALITPGQKITYITDVIYSEINIAKIIKLAYQSDHLFIEAVFLDKDQLLARQKYHLTAHQAGSLAARSRAAKFSLFHFSPRYIGQEDQLTQEASHAFNI